MLDRYYTPESVAKRIVAKSDFARPRSCADTTCGSGNLLSAADSIYRGTVCIGADKDREAIRQLRRNRPEWTLSVADILDGRSHSKAAVFKRQRECDLLLLNPPFSMEGRKSIDAGYRGHSLRTSVAMAYLLQSTELLRPRLGVIAVVPESLLFAAVDGSARQLLGSDYKIEKVCELSHATFAGARAHTTVIRMTPGKTLLNDVRSNSIGAAPAEPVAAQIVRGGLPVFEAKSISSGMPFIHSTDLHTIAKDPRTLGHLPKVGPIDRGTVSGFVVLIPRVGLPCRSAMVPVHLSTAVQLSDCVIALQCLQFSEVKRLANLLLQDWSNFTDIFRGTGARYVTVERLRSYLASLQADA